MAGTDLDGDGFFCESRDACGWYGGPTEADVVPVPLSEGQTFLGAEILLFPPSD